MTAKETSEHRPFRIVAHNDGYFYFVESWRFLWELVDVDGTRLASSTRYPIFTVAEARLAVVEALDALGLGDAALRIDPLSIVEAGKFDSRYLAEPEHIAHRPLLVTRKDFGRRFPDRAWYWSIVDHRGHAVGKSPDYETEQECNASLSRAVDVIYGSTGHIEDLVKRPEKEATGRRMWSLR